MNKPAKLVFSDQASFRLARGIVLIPFAIISFSFMLVLLTTEATLVELSMPCLGISGIGFIWVGILGIVALGHRIAERRAINRMFAGEIWECWQFRASAWQALVEAECKLISPKDEGRNAYMGAVYSSIFGIIIAIIIAAVGAFAIDEPELKSVMWITALAVFLLLLGIGLFQPTLARTNANRYRRKAMRAAEPRVWFTSDGIYHETLGYTSLKELIKVTDQTKSRQAIRFDLKIATDESSDLAVYRIPVPAGCEEQAGRLVRRYRQERLRQGTIL